MSRDTLMIVVKSVFSLLFLTFVPIAMESLSKTGWILLHIAIGVLVILLLFFRTHVVFIFVIVKACSVIPAVIGFWYIETHPDLSPTVIGWVPVCILSVNMLEVNVVELFGRRRRLDSILNGIVGLLLIAVLRPGMFRVNDGVLEGHLGWAWVICYTFWDLSFIAGWWTKELDKTAFLEKEDRFSRTSAATLHVAILLAPVLGSMVCGGAEFYLKFRTVTLVFACSAFLAFRPTVYRVFGFPIERLAGLRKWIVACSVVSGIITLLVRI